MSPPTASSGTDARWAIVAAGILGVLSALFAAVWVVGLAVRMAGGEYEWRLGTILTDIGDIFIFGLGAWIFGGIAFRRGDAPHR